MDHEERTAAGYPPSVVGGDALPHHAEHAHDSPQRHTPGVTPGVCEPSTPDERYSSPRRPESGVLRVAPALRLGEQRPSQQLPLAAKEEARNGQVDHWRPPESLLRHLTSDVPGGGYRGVEEHLLPGALRGGS